MRQSGRSRTLEEDGLPFQGDEPHLWIQWKGSDICCDIHCKCGAHLHYDGFFLYSLKCGHCDQIYNTGSHVKLYPVEYDPEEYYHTDALIILHDEDEE